MAANKPAFHEVVATKLIEQIQSGTAPWQKPWKAGSGGFMPLNPTTGNRYKGINAVHLMSEGRTDPRWLTYKQAKGLGAQVRRWESGTQIQCWKFQEQQDRLDERGRPILDDSGKPQKVTVQLERPRVFFATVFNAEQIDGMPPLQESATRRLVSETIDQVAKGAKLLDQLDSTLAKNSAKGLAGLAERLERERERGEDPVGVAISTINDSLELLAPFQDQAEIGSQAKDLVRVREQFDNIAWERHGRAEHILQASGANLTHDQGDRAFYRPSTDSIHLPRKEQFDTADRYYSTALHELGHWSGHPSRLDRDLSHPFGSEGYAREELRAEIASMILGDDLGIGHDTQQHASYVKSWVKVLKEDPLEIFRAASDAEKIQNYVLSLEQQQIQERTQSMGDKFVADSNPEREQFQAVSDRQPNIQSEEQEKRSAVAAIPVGWRGPACVAFDKEMAKRTGDSNYDRARQLSSMLNHFDEMSFEPSPQEKKILEERKAEIEEATEWIRENVLMNPVIKEQMYETVRDLGRETGDSEEDRNRREYLDEMEASNLKTNSVELRPEEMLGLIENASTERHYIDVPFEEKEEAKSLGARWDRKERSWYVPPGVDQEPFAKWEAGETAEKAAKLKSSDQPQDDRTYLAVPYTDRREAKASGARWDSAAKSWYAAEGADMQKLSRWLPERQANEQAPAMDPRSEFANELQAMGLVVKGDHPRMDGKSHRVPVEGDGRRDLSGFYRGFLDGRPAGYIKNHKTGQETRWKAKGYSMSEEDRAQMQAEAAAKLAQREQERQGQYEATAERVANQLSVLEPVGPQLTPYLASKGIEEHTGVFTDKEGRNTFLPAYDVDGKQWSLQTIGEDGAKRFAKDSRKEGCFHVVGGMDALERAPAIVVGEGYATAATLAESLGYATVASFDAGNLLPVVQALHERYPEKPIIVAGDDDLRTQQIHGNNPGREFAESAAKAVGGRAIFPVFHPGEQENEPKRYSDFNDLAHNSQLGKEGVRRQIHAAVNASLLERGDRHQLAAQQDQVAERQQHRPARRKVRA